MNVCPLCRAPVYRVRLYPSGETVWVSHRGQISCPKNKRKQAPPKNKKPGRF